MCKKLLSALLVILIIISNLMVCYSANANTSDFDLSSAISQMDVVAFGSYPQSDVTGTKKDSIKWQVLDRDTENNRALLFSVDILDSDSFNTEIQTKTTYEDSVMRRFLNNNFYNKAFDDTEKSYILTTINANENNSKYNSEGGNATEDKVFLLSENEIRKYYSIEQKLEADIIDNSIYAEATEYSQYIDNEGKTKKPNCFWLRSPGRQDNQIQNVNLINLTGIYLDLIGKRVDTVNGIRPAIWVRYDSNSGGANSTTNLSTIADLNDNTDNIYEVQVSKEVESLSFESNASVNAVENEVSSSEDSGNKVNNVLWDNINVEGVNVYQNSDGSITIGGDAQEGAKLIQSGTGNNEIELDEKEKLDKIIEEYNNSTIKKPIDRVYYYAKHNDENKIVTSINKRNLYNGLLGIPLFSNKTYYNIEIKFNEETRKKLSKYAESEWNGAWREGKNWVLLAGDSISNLENVSWLGVSPYTETDRMVHTEGVSYYQKGKIQLNLLSENEQKRVYSKIKNAKDIILATGNIIKSYDKKIDDEEKLGDVERFEYVKDDGSHINLVNAYLDCEDKIIDYTATHLGYFLYVKDGFSGDLAYHEEIVAPKKHCSKFEILVFGNDSLSYSIYGNKVNFLAGKNVGGLKKFEVYGGKMWWEYELDTENGFEDYEKYYIENKDKW